MRTLLMAKVALALVAALSAGCVSIDRVGTAISRGRRSAPTKALMGTGAVVGGVAAAPAAIATGPLKFLAWPLTEATADAFGGYGCKASAEVALWPIQPCALLGAYALGSPGIAIDGLRSMLRPLLRALRRRPRAVAAAPRAPPPPAPPLPPGLPAPPLDAPGDEPPRSVPAR